MQVPLCDLVLCILVSVTWCWVAVMQLWATPKLQNIGEGGKAEADSMLCDHVCKDHPPVFTLI